MKTRLLAALVGLLVLLPSIVFGGELAVEIIAPLAMLVCLDEYARMAFPRDHAASLAWLVLGSAAVYAVPLYIGPEPVGGVAMAVTMATLSFVMLRPGPAADAAHPLAETTDKVGRFLLGFGWIAGFMAFLPLIRRLEDGLAWIFLLLAIPWLGDTGGYFAGRAFGNRKLYPLVSPKKTWEGLLGGLLMSVVGVLVVRAVALPALNVADCLFLGVALGTAGVVGDLSESMIKRAFNVKDSGWIMPGHGGLLDRIDSLLFVGPLLYTYARLVKGVG